MRAREKDSSGWRGKMKRRKLERGIKEQREKESKKLKMRLS